MPRADGRSRSEHGLTKLLGISIANGYSPEARVFAELLANRDARYDASVLYHGTAADPDDVAKFRRISGARVLACDMGWRNNPDGHRTTAAKIHSFVRFQLMLGPLLHHAIRYRPDVIFSNQQRWDSFAATIVARWLRKPQVILLCYPIGPWLGLEVVRRLRTCEHVAAICDYARANAIQHGVDPARVTTVFPPVDVAPPVPAGTRADVRRELRIPGDAPVAGIVARLDRQKGQADAIAAFASLAARQPEARLLIVGHTATTGGTPREVLERQAAETGFGERIVFEGYRADFQRVLSALDVFLHPALDDTISLAPLRAAAAGLPVVAYADSGALNTVVHDRTGLLAPPGDRAALAAYLNRLFGDKDAARRMGGAARERIRTDFDPVYRGRLFGALLDRVAREGRRSGR